MISSLLFFYAMDEKTKLSLEEFEALMKEALRGDCDECAQEYREKLLHTDFYLRQLKDLHQNLLNP